MVSYVLNKFSLFYQLNGIYKMLQFKFYILYLIMTLFWINGLTFWVLCKCVLIYNNEIK